MSEPHVLEVSEVRRRRWRAYWWDVPVGAPALRGLFYVTEAWLADRRPGCSPASRRAIAWRVVRLALLLECGVRVSDCAVPLRVSARQVRCDYRLLRDVLSKSTPVRASELPDGRPPNVTVKLARWRSDGLPDRPLDSHTYS